MAMSLSTTASHLTTIIDGETSGSLVACIWETIRCISGIQVDQKKFVEIASYLYRACPVIKMLEMTSSENQSNTMEILGSLSRRIQLSRDVLEESISSSQQLHGIIKQMEGLIHYIGEGLASIQASTFGEHGYAEIAARSLSEEMKRAQFEDAPTPTTLDQYHPQEPSSSSSSSSEIMRDSSTGGVGRYVEPPYESFFCPLTKKILRDPVTIQSGATFERDAISKWFQTQVDQHEEVTCPATGQKLFTKLVFPSIAFKAIIHEWEERNLKGKINVILAVLSLASSDSMIIEALKDLKSICQGRPDRTRQVVSKGITPLVVKLLEYKDSIVRHATLETLQLLAVDDDGKELIGETTTISLTVRMISSRFQAVKHAALLLLVELSNSVTLSEKIGWVTGGILMLIRTKYDRSTDTFASEAANLILNNLAQSPYNIKCMAENGFLEPLLDRLIGGSEYMKAEMASYLAEVGLGQDDDAFVFRKAYPTLIQMARNENAPIRKAAFKALVPISSLHQNAKLLVEAGIAQVVGEEMFTRNNYIEQSDALQEAAGILANLLESDLDLEKVQVTRQGHTITSDYVASSIIYMLTTSKVDEISLNLVRTISCLTKWSMPNIVSAIRDGEACYTLLELINNSDEQLGVAAIKLLIKLAQHQDMGEILVDKLCKIHGQPQGLVQRPSHMTHITERQALSAKLLNMLPHENLQLNLSLISENIASTVIQTINEIQATRTRKSRYASDYLEGLVGILVRFTATLYEPQILYLAANSDFTTIFKDMLMESTSAQVKRLAATGLEKLSVQSIKLSKPEKVERRLSMTSFSSPRSSRKSKMTVCPIHRGVCSARTTFCLVESGAIEALLLCLDHQNAGVVEAALSALSTLVDDNVDTEKSMSILNEMKATQQVMKLVKDHTEEGLLQIAYRMIERFLSLGGEDLASVALQDRKFNSKLINSFYHGEAYTKQIVEKILTHLRIMPGSTVTFS